MKKLQELFNQFESETKPKGIFKQSLFSEWLDGQYDFDNGGYVTLSEECGLVTTAELRRLINHFCTKK
jgi:hypothetical protein